MGRVRFSRGPPTDTSEKFLLIPSVVDSRPHRRQTPASTSSSVPNQPLATNPSVISSATAARSTTVSSTGVVSVDSVQSWRSSRHPERQHSRRISMPSAPSAAIDLDTKLILGVDVFARRGTDSAAAFLRDLDEKHDLSAAGFLVDSYGYLTALARIGSSGRLDTSTETRSRSGFRRLRCGSTASTNHGWAVDRASAGGLRCLCTTTITNDHIRRSMDARQLRRC